MRYPVDVITGHVDAGNHDILAAIIVNIVQRNQSADSFALFKYVDGRYPNITNRELELFALGATWAKLLANRGNKDYVKDRKRLLPMSTE